MIKAINKLLDPVKRQIRNSIARGILTLIDDTTALQRVQVQMMAFPQPDGSMGAELNPDIEVMAHYAFTSVPFAGAEAAYISVGGVRAHGLVIATDDRRFRPTDLAPGESKHYDDQGQFIYLSRAGIVISGAGLPITITDTPSLTVNASDQVVLNTPLLQVNGQIVATGNVTAGSVDLEGHVHGGVQAGGASTSTPHG